MLTQKVDNKKNLIYGVIFCVILIIIAVLLFKNYVSSGSLEEKNSFLEPQLIFQAIDMPIKKFDAAFLKDSRYNKLKDNSVKIKDIANLKIGKENPFISN